MNFFLSKPFSAALTIILLILSINSPMTTRAESIGCLVSTEICGDGIDQDCNGSDLFCSGLDSDRDGFQVGVDCDDANSRIYPGRSVECSSSCGRGTKTCKTNGSYSPCSCTPLCEATGSGRCYYVAAAFGSDNSNGTFNAPWKTLRNLASYYSGSDAPSNAVNLSPGDVVYLIGDYYRDTYEYDGSKHAIVLRNINGTASNPITIKAYPEGSVPLIWPIDRATGMWIFQSSYIILDGIEISGAYQQGLLLEESSNIKLQNIRIHDTDGVDNDNIAGLRVVDVRNLEVHHSAFHDNYDRTNADTQGMKTENSRNIVLFGGGGIVRFHHNVIYHTQNIGVDKTGSCLAYKHAASIPNSVFEVDNNVFTNCFFESVGSGTNNSRIHHNLIIDSDPIKIMNHGGVTNIDNILIENNTSVGNIGLYYQPSSEYNPLGLLTYRKNIVVDTGAYSQERGIVTVDPYGDDSTYDDVVAGGKISIDNNCYFNPRASLRWALFAANGGNYGIKGALHNFQSWQQVGFDTHSATLDPQLDSSHFPHNSTCANYGHLAK